MHLAPCFSPERLYSYDTIVLARKTLITEIYHSMRRDRVVRIVYPFMISALALCITRVDGAYIAFACFCSQVVWNFGSLTDEAETDYIKAKMGELCPIPLDAGPAASSASAPASLSIFDEFKTPTSRCPMCAAPHFGCAVGGCAPLPEDVRKALAYAPPPAPEDAYAASTLPWTSTPINASRDDLDVMSR